MFPKGSNTVGWGSAEKHICDLWRPAQSLKKLKGTGDEIVIKKLKIQKIINPNNRKPSHAN